MLSISFFLGGKVPRDNQFAISRYFENHFPFVKFVDNKLYNIIFFGVFSLLSLVLLCFCTFHCFCKCCFFQEKKHPENVKMYTIVPMPPNSSDFS